MLQYYIYDTLHKLRRGYNLIHLSLALSFKVYKLLIIELQGTVCIQKIKVIIALANGFSIYKLCKVVEKPLLFKIIFYFVFLSLSSSSYNSIIDSWRLNLHF